VLEGAFDGTGVLEGTLDGEGVLEGALDGGVGPGSGILPIFREWSWLLKVNTFSSVPTEIVPVHDPVLTETPSASMK